MSEEMKVLSLCLAAAYLIGGIPFGFVIGKLRGVDVRTVGSKNIGATNVFRTVGKKWGFLALFCDVLKGAIPTYIATRLVVNPEIPTYELTALFTGLMCVIGHMLTPYMKFRGGKGVATGVGMLIGLMPPVAGLSFLVFVIVFALSNYISLGSCTAAAFLGVLVWIPVEALSCKGFHDPVTATLVSLLAVFIIYKHRSNIVRLVQGNENKIYIFKKPTK